MTEEEEFEFQAALEAEQASAGAQEPGIGSKIASALVPNAMKADNTPVPNIGFGQYAGMGGKTTPVTRPQNAGEKAVYKTYQGASDLMELPKRALGAATFQADGNDFMARMADPESGLLRTARQALARSDAPLAAKLLGGVAIGAAEDPLTLLAAGLKAFEIAKANGQVFSNASKALKVSPKIAEAASMTSGRKGVSTGVVEGVPFSRAQQASLTGETITPSIERVARTEADIMAKNRSVWDAFQAEQGEAVAEKAGAFKAKHAFSDQSPKDLTESVIGKIDDAFEANKVKYKAKYETLEKSMASAAPSENKALEDAKSAMDGMGVYPVEKGFDAGGNAVVTPKFTTTKVVDRTAKVIDEKPVIGAKGNFVSDINGNQVMKTGEKTVPTVEFVTQDYYGPRGISVDGVSDRASDALMEARKIIEKESTYDAMKRARSLIGDHIGAIYKAGPNTAYGYADMGKLKQAYKKLSAAMEERVRAVGGDAAVSEWTTADKLFSNRGDFAKLKKILYPGKSENGLPAEDVLKRLTNSANGNNFDALMKIKEMEAGGVLPEGVGHNLQNALFNDIMEKSTRTVNGRKVVDGELLMKSVNNIRPTFYNEIWTDDQANDIAQLVLEGMAQKLSNKMKILDQNPTAASKMLRDAGMDIGMWALMKGGPKGWLKWKAGKLLAKALMTRGDRAATRYIRSVNKQSITNGLFRNAAARSLPLQAAEAPASPGQGQPTPSQEFQGP